MSPNHRSGFKPCPLANKHSSCIPVPQVLAGLEEFGRSDDLYSLLNEYEVNPWETWTIEEKVIHAPGKTYTLPKLAILVCVYYVGPWLTFEIQLPQDDFHLLAWVLGTPVSEDELPPLKQAYNLRGLSHPQQLLKGIATY